MRPDKGAILVTAYQDADIDFERHEATGSPIPCGDTSVLVLSVVFPLSAQEKVYSLPLEPDEGPAIILMMTDWRNPGSGFALRD